MLVVVAFGCMALGNLEMAIRSLGNTCSKHSESIPMTLTRFEFLKDRLIIFGTIFTARNLSSARMLCNLSTSSSLSDMYNYGSHRSGTNPRSF